MTATQTVDKAKEITFNELKNHLGKKITMKLNGKQDTFQLERVTEKKFIVKLKRKDKFNGIEMHYENPTDPNVKFYLA